MSVLTEQQQSKAFWGGTLKGTLKGIVVGLALGAIAASALYFGLDFLGEKAPDILKNTLGNFVGGKSFNPLPLMTLNATLSGVSGLLTSGKQAVAALEAKVERALNLNKVQHLEHQVTLAHAHDIPQIGHSQSVDQPLPAQHQLQSSVNDKPLSLAENIEHDGRITGVQSRMVH